MTSGGWDRHQRIADSLMDVIGYTPLVRLREASAHGPEVLGKIEWYSPSGSLKDRIYAHMIARAEADGRLKPGMTVLECSTGNAGIACAFVAAMKGYRCVIVMPEGMSLERKKLMQAYGAELVFTPGGESDVDLALARLEEVRGKDPDRYWVPAQFENPHNIEAHYLTTGPEIWEQTQG
ncbi:MAG: PLP-dependent cysteine synthase family protein, partial [Candidatus Methylomirabilales bacterium]